MPTLYFIDYATGSDSNSGMSKSGPWKTAPGMANQGARTYAHSAGDRFIFKGGVTWPIPCFPWNIPTGGAAGNSDFYTIDQTWFSGSSWTKPQFDFGGATTGTGNGLAITAKYIFVQNIEFYRFRGTGSFGTAAIAVTNGDTDFINPTVSIDNCHFRALLHLATAVTGNNCCVQANYTEFDATENVRHNDPCNVQGSIILLDTAPNVVAAYNVSITNHCYFHDIPNACLGGGSHHDNEYANIRHAYSEDGDVHGNCIEPFTNCDIYNNLIHDLQPTVEAILCDPQQPSLFRIYNNVIWNSGGKGIGTDTRRAPANSVVYKIYNNTLGANSGGIGLNSPGVSFPHVQSIDVRNNHFANGQGFSYIANFNGSAPIITSSPNLLQSTAEATAAGYTTANLYRPTFATAPTATFAGQSVSSVVSQDREGVPRPQGSWDAGAYEFVGSPGDTTPPSVTLTAPASGANLSGTANLSATASDNVGVAAVTFYVDNSPVATLTTPTSGSTYSTTLDTTSLSNGAHTIRADARDAAGNVGSSSVSVTVANGSTGGGGTGPNLLANPSFEVGPFDVGGTVSGWVVVGRVKDSNEAGAAGGTGRAAQFGYGGNFQGNSLSQDVPTTSGQQYTVAFDSGIFGQPSSPITLRVQVIGAGATSLLDQTVAPTANNSFNTATVPFSRYTFHFTANGSTATLRFTDIGTGNASADLLVDNTSVTSDTPAPGPAVLSLSANSCDWGYVAESDTPLDKTITLTNTGASNMTGTASGATGNFSIVGTASYDLDPAEQATITLRYRPTVKGIHTATLNLTGGGGGSVALRGACYPVAGGLTGIQAEDALIVAPFTVASGLVSQSIETTDPRFGGLLVIGFVIVTPGQYTVQCLVNAPSESANSFFVEEGAEPTDPADVWDVGVTSGAEVRTVGARGTGAFNDPQFPVRVFDWSSGRKFLVIRGREAGAAIDSLTIAVVAPPPAPPVTPSTPSPADTATGVSTTLAALSWSADGTTYDFKFGTSSPPSIVATGLVSATFLIASPLANSTDYFWQVVSRGPGGVTTGPVWKFTTAAPPPSPPANPLPADTATDVSLTPSLRWESSATPFSVKLDTVNPPVQVAGSGIVPAQLDISTKLTPSTVYYWQVNAGPIWSFTTVAVAPARTIPAIIIVRRA